MGYDERKLTIIARVSRHNSERDRADDEAWEALVREIDKLLERPEFKAITANRD